MRRVNLVFLAVLLTALGSLAGGIHLVHGVQVRRNASALLERARRAERGNDLEMAQEALSQYLKFRRDDGQAWARYARLVELRDADHRNREHVFLIHEEALRYNLGDAKLERRCALLAFELERYGDAQRHLKTVLEQAAKSSENQPTSVELAEMEDLLGQCDRGLARYEEAEKWFIKALEHDPNRVDCYDRLARMRRTELRRIGAADNTIKEMVAKNPTAGRTFLFRWRYSQEFLQASDAGDLQRALELAPDDPEVLFTAAVVSEQNQDVASARLYFSKGAKVDPKRADFALGLARLEMREARLDRAEAVLRQGFQAAHTVDIAFSLAEALILQDKIDGKDQARDYINLLRNAGLGSTLVPFLESRILVQQKQWAQAITRLETARALLGSNRRLIAQVDLLLVECYGRLGFDEQRLDALRRVAESDKSGETTRVELSQALAGSGKIDQALATLLPLVARRPERYLDLARILLQRTIRQPKDRRNWPEVEQLLNETEKALPRAVEPVVLMRFDMLAAQDKLQEAQSLLSTALSKEPRNLRYRLGQARLNQLRGQGPASLQALNEIEKDLGPSPELDLARLDYWGAAGGNEATAAVSRLAATRDQVAAADRPALLDRLAAVELRLGQPELARNYRRELAALEPDNLTVRLALFDQALTAGDEKDAAAVVGEIRKVEGDEGLSWRFAQAALVIDRVRRGRSRDLEEARMLSAEISRRNPQWANGLALSGEIADLSGSIDHAIRDYQRAVELGAVQPSLVRRLVGLLNERQQFDEIDRLAHLLRDQGAALNEVILVQSLDAIRKQDFQRGISLAREVFRETSKSYSDHLTLGRIYLAAGRVDDAGTEFRRAVELGPGVPEAWLTYIQYLVQFQRIDQVKAAVDSAQRALSADRSGLVRAKIWMIAGDMKQAETLIQEVLEINPQDPEALRVAASLYFGQNLGQKAIDYLDKFDRVAGSSPDEQAWSNRVRAGLLLKTGRQIDHHRALELVERNLKNNPASAEDQLAKATVLAAVPKRRQDAIKILEAMAGANRLDAKEHFLLAQLYLDERREENYLAEMKKLLDVRVRDPRHLAHFVNYWIVRRQLDQADRWLAELKKADPQGLAVLELEARLLDLGKRTPELLALLEAHGRQFPDQIGIVADLMYRYRFVKQAELAKKNFVARDPDQPERALALARFLAMEDRVAEAMEILKKAWSTCPPEQVAAVASIVFDSKSADPDAKRQVEAWIIEAIRKRPDAVSLKARLGSIRIRQNRLDEASDWYRRILAENPDNADALNNLAWILALRDQGTVQEALRLIDHAIDVRGAIPTLYDTRAVVLIRAGELDRAVRDLVAARAGAPGNPNVPVHLAWAYQEGGRTDEARIAFRQAKELGWNVNRSDPLERTYIDKVTRALSQ